MHMSHVTSGLIFALTGWFALNFSGVAGLVSAAPLFSPAGLMLFLLPVLALMGLGRAPFTPLFVVAVMAIWFALQYQIHWQGFFLGATPDKVLWHRSLWGDTWQLLPRIAGHTVPDGYHTVLGGLIFASLLSSLRDCFRSGRAIQR